VELWWSKALAGSHSRMLAASQSKRLAASQSKGLAASQSKGLAGSHSKGLACTSSATEQGAGGGHKARGWQCWAAAHVQQTTT
jgi:hypothetical protein